ncbi:MAG: hypothetical protein ISR50_17705 [Alphaproteobacteria bacterium]|nr:hypothetical protein [Alphaproteobacteria bacterium]
MDQPRQAHRRSSEDNGNVVLMSLYLLLVAFFILLNSMAHYEVSRVEEVMGSVKSEFRNQWAVADTGLSVPSQRGLAPAVDDFHGEVRQFFEETLPVDHVEPERRGDMIRFAVPVDDLFRPDAVAPRPRGRAFLDRMASSLKKVRPGLQAEVEMVLGTGITLPGGDDAVGAFEMRRVSSLAHALRRRGVAAMAMRTGLMPGDPGQISFIFRVHDETRARVTFSELVVRQ